MIHDVCSFSNDVPEHCREKILARLNTIQQRIGHGAETLKALNRLAHSADREAEESDVRSAVTDIVTLTRRLASARKTELRAVEPGPGITLAVDPLIFRTILFLGIQSLLHVTSTDDEIIFEIQENKGSCAIAIRLTPSQTDIEAANRLMAESPDWHRLVDRVEALEGSISRLPDSVGIELRFPA